MTILGVALALAFDAEAASCRGYPEAVRPIIKSRVEALRMIEREAADRLVGLDTRTFPFLAGEARKVVDVIADPAVLADEDTLKRCRNHVPPVRGICRSAAVVLAVLLDEQEAGESSKASRQAYAEAMAPCEKLMRLPPMSTALRASD
jgi:hypothetical protein